MSVVSATCFILTVAVIICAFEDLSLNKRLFRNNLFDWRYCLAFQPKLRPAPGRRLPHAAFGVTAFRMSAVLRIAGVGTGAAFILSANPYVVVPLALVLIGYFYLFYRLPYALDGADQMTLFVLIGLMIMLLDRGAGDFVRLGATAVTLHTAVSYITSGVAKLGSPIWRSGAGLSGIMNSGEFGNRPLAGLISRCRGLHLLLSWAVMLTHVAVGVAILAGGPIVYAALAAAMAFHIAVALTMRLNNFVWAFGAAYPSILFMADWDQRALFLHDLAGL